MYFPLLIDLKKSKVLVVGGGSVSTRKVKNLIDYQCLPDIISPAITDELNEIIKKNGIRWVKRIYARGDAFLYSLVFCSTGDLKADNLVHFDCSEKGILLNVADVPDLCSFILPATVKRGNLTVSAASQGSAPFFIKSVREMLENIFPSEYSEITELAGEFRELVLNRKAIISSNGKEDMFREFLKVNWIKLIRESGMEIAKKTMYDILNLK